MEKVEKAKYLGGILTKKADPNTETQAIITATTPVVTSLDLLWKKTNCSISWKLLIFQAVVISKLLYGLETLIASEATLHKIDTFQMKRAQTNLRYSAYLHRQITSR